MGKYQRSIASLQHQERKALTELLKVLANDSEPIVSRSRLESMVEQLENLDILEMDEGDIAILALLLTRCATR